MIYILFGMSLMLNILLIAVLRNKYEKEEQEG